MGYCWFEGVFLNKEDVEKAFVEASGDFPKYEYVPDNYHVTTKYTPELS